MLRKILLFGAFVATAAAFVPAFHQQNPEAFGAILRPFLQNGDHAQPAPTMVARADIPSKAEVLPGRKVRVPADARGHYMADFKLNGRTVTALLDTGATYVAINQSTARRIGLKLGPSDFRHQVNTANGTTPAAVANIDALQIGRIHVEDVEAVVLKDEALDGTLVGMSFLNRLARFQVERGSLLLEQ